MYDEGGGGFDHVSPPRACKPDEVLPIRDQGEKALGDFERYGFRVPFVALSPWVKRHYVSHVVYDHTSVLKFIESQFNVLALTGRDANADAMSDLFDFDHPDFSRPWLPHPKVQLSHILGCILKKGYRDTP